MTVGLFVLAVVSGMLGLGVAFAAIPFLSLFISDLVHRVQPLSLLLNGITALFSVLGFAMSGLIDWKKALLLSGVTVIFAPLGSWLASANIVKPIYIWIIYLISVIYLAYRLMAPTKQGQSAKASGKGDYFWVAFLLAAPISVLSGLLGVGPGFLLMPTLILVGIEPKRAAAINAFAVTPPSFSALLPHLSTARFDPVLTLALLIAGAVGSFLGARLTSLYIPGLRLKQIFALLIVAVTLYKLVTML
jgi:uncharacterized membrane protein YfcA